MTTRFVLIRKTFTLMVFFLFGLPASAQWTQTSGPEGGNAVALLATHNYVLVGLEKGGVYRSTDLGATWHYASYGLGGDGAGGNCFAELGPYVFVGSDRGVSRSTNQGLTWSALDVGAPWYGMLVSSLFADGPTLYLGSPWQGVYASTDSGTTWIKKSNGLADSVVMALLADAGYLFAGTDGGGIYRSTDNGNSWQSSSTGLGTGEAQRVYGLASAGGVLVAGTRAAAYRSTDHGSTWSIAASGLSSKDIASLGTSGTAFLAGTYGGGVYRSTDGGINWQWSSTGWVSGNVRAFSTVGDVVFGSSYGDSVVYKSTDGGIQWSPSKTGIASKSIVALAVDGTTILAGSSGGIEVSNNAGASWATAPGLVSTLIYSFAHFGNWIFAGTNGDGVFASSDHGATWFDANGNLPNVGWLPVYSTVADSVYVTIGTILGIYRSSDRGTTWEPASSGMTDSVAYALCSANGTLFAGTSTLMYRSTDHGTSWHATTAGLPSYKILSIESMDSIVLAAYALGGNPTVYRSTDFGLSWNPTTRGLETASALIQTLHVVGANIFGGTQTDGVWLSTDRGENWSDISDGLSGPGLAVSALTTMGGTLYAGMERGGVWIRPLSEVVASVEVQRSNRAVAGFSLEQNYPNPFNPTTTIRYELPGSSQVKLSVYDVLGREVSVLVNERTDAGVHDVKFDAAGLSSGVYFYRIRAADFVQSRQLLLLR